MLKAPAFMAAALAVGFIGVSGAAQAAPATALVGGATALTDDARALSGVSDVRWVCGPYGRCVWVRHRPRVYGYYGHRPFYGHRPYYAARPWYGPRYHVGPRRWHRPYW